MNKSYYKLFFILILFLFSNSYSQILPNRVSVTSSANYITAFDVFFNPRADDEVERNVYSTVEKIFSYSFEVRYEILENSIFIGLGTEILKKDFSNGEYSVLVNNIPAKIATKEEYFLTPIELNVYYILPFSSEQFKFYFGGGGDLYFGDYKRTIGNLQSTTIKKGFDYGFNVSVGMEYFPFKFLSIRGEMKFREPDLEFKNEFTQNTTTINGNTIRIFQQDFHTRVNLNGIIFNIGANFYF